MHILHFLRNRTAALCLAGLATSSIGCAALFVPNEDPSDAERQQIDVESAPYRQKGTASVSGIVTLDTPSGRMVATAGAQVYLTPATSSSLQRLQEYGIEKNELPPSRYADVVWMGVTDAQGRFDFEGLPAGQYIAACQIGWSPPSGGVKLDVAYARFQLAAGEHATVELTRRDDGK